MTPPLVVRMELLDREQLRGACNAVIDALSKYSPEYKIGALHYLLESFPVPYEITEGTAPWFCRCGREFSSEADSIGCTHD